MKIGLMSLSIRGKEQIGLDAMTTAERHIRLQTEQSVLQSGMHLCAKNVGGRLMNLHRHSCDP